MRILIELPQAANISVSCNLVASDTLDFALPIIRSSFPPGTKYQAWGRITRRLQESRWWLRPVVEGLGQSKGRAADATYMTQ
jgi:hypothetical protein